MATQAKSFQVYQCPSCKAVHVDFFDAAGAVIADMVMTTEVALSVADDLIMCARPPTNH